MSRKISEETKNKIYQLHEQGISRTEIAKQIQLPYSTVQVMIKLRAFGLDSIKEYHKHLIQQRGFKNQSEYQEDLAKRNGFESYSKYREYSVQKRGFKNLTAYKNSLNQKRSERKSNKELSNLIKNRLKYLEKSQNQFAKEIGKTRQAVSLYIHGKILPSRKIREKISRALEVNSNSLEEILDE